MGKKKQKNLKILSEHIGSIVGVVGALFVLIQIVLPEVKALWTMGYPWAAISLVVFSSSMIIWFIALISPQRKTHINWLRDEKLASGYRNTVTLILSKLDGVLSKYISRGQQPVAYYWSADLLGFTLLVAIAYPVLSLLSQWLFSGDAALIGSVAVFQAATEWQRLFAGLMLLIGGYFIYVGKFKSKQSELHRFTIIILAVTSILGVINFAINPEWVSLLLPNLIVIVFYFSFIFINKLLNTLRVKSESIRFFTVIITAVVVMGVVVGAGAFAVVFALAFAIEGAVAFAFAVAVAGAVVLLGEKYLKNNTPLRLLSFLFLYLLLASIVVIFSQIKGDLSRSLLVFLCFFPLANAIFDYLSIGLTRYLLQKSIDARHPILRGIGDAIAAVALFLLLKFCLVSLFILLDDASGTPILNLLGEQGLLNALRQQPENYYWLYFTLFSTLIPTLIHLNIACFSIVSSPFFGLTALIQNLAAWLKKPSEGWLKAMTAFITLCLLSTLFVVLPAFLLSNLWQLLVGNHVTLLELSLQLAENWAVYLSEWKAATF